MSQRWTELQQSLDSQYAEGKGKVDEQLRRQYRACREKLERCQGEDALVQAVVTESVIADVLASRTGNSSGQYCFG